VGSRADDGGRQYVAVWSFQPPGESHVRVFVSCLTFSWFVSYQAWLDMLLRAAHSSIIRDATLSLAECRFGRRLTLLRQLSCVCGAKSLEEAAICSGQGMGDQQRDWDFSEHSCGEAGFCEFQTSGLTMHMMTASTGLRLHVKRRNAYELTKSGCVFVAPYCISATCIHISCRRVGTLFWMTGATNRTPSSSATPHQSLLTPMRRALNTCTGSRTDSCTLQICTYSEKHTRDSLVVCTSLRFTLQVHI